MYVFQVRSMKLRRGPVASTKSVKVPGASLPEFSYLIGSILQVKDALIYPSPLVENILYIL